jgi:hypothetical protein
MELDPVFKSGRLLNLKNDAKTERIKAQTHTQKTNEFQNLDWRFSEK